LPPYAPPLISPYDSHIGTHKRIKLKRCNRVPLP
jgi:hypothetical protein